MTGFAYKSSKIKHVKKFSLQLTGGSSRGGQGKGGLDGEIHGGNVESLEHDLAQLMSVDFRGYLVSHQTVSKKHFKHQLEIKTLLDVAQIRLGNV